MPLSRTSSRVALASVGLLASGLVALTACSTGKPEAEEPKEAAITRRKPPAFKPPPLASLPDQGSLKAQRLARPVSALKKLCPPAKKKKESAIACMCPAVGEPTQQDGWTDASESCAAAAQGLEAPYLNVQLLAAQKSFRQKKSEETTLDVQFQFLMQTKKGWSAFEIGSTTMEPALGYPRAFTLVSRDFVDLPEGGSKEILAVFNDERTTYDDQGPKKSSSGWLLVCGANASQKLSCAEPLPLGAARKKGYQLDPVVENGSLYLVETHAKVAPEVKKIAGKYSFELLP
jgi:hypothetical protein